MVISWRLSRFTSRNRKLKAKVMEYNQHVYHFNPNRPLYSIDDLDMALVLSHTGDFDPSNPARIQLLQPNPDSEGGAEEEEERLSDHF
jgi:hypothetical protein